MSTRAIIARPAEGPVGSFEGRYHHYDGYPSGLGAQLWRLLHADFAGDVHSLLRTLLDDHPAGWSDLSVQRCYCHGPRPAAPTPFLNDHSDDAGADWAYVIDPLRELFSVYRRCGQRWALAGAVPFGATEPDWKHLQHT